MSNGLYIHIPFCASKCAYCDFLSFAGREADFERYVDALEKEMALRSSDTVYDTVYIGGGTPNVLPPFLLKRIFDALKTHFFIEKDAEITFEANPCAFTDNCMAVNLKNLGVNRVSMGLQSVNEDTLRLLGRRHTVSDFAASVRALQSAKISNISGDLMLGLPNQTENELKNAAELLADLGLKHVSAYALKVENGTPLKKMVASGKIKLPDDDKTADLYEFTVKELQKHGFERYEVSNFCKSGFHSRHNLNCWLCEEYLGLGLGAHSYMNNSRFSNVRNLENYISKLQNGILPVSKTTKIDKIKKINERIMLGLRLETGFSYRKLNEDFGINYLKQCKNAEKLAVFGLISLENGFVRILPDKFYTMNSIIADLLLE